MMDDALDTFSNSTQCFLFYIRGVCHTNKNDVSNKNLPILLEGV